MSAISRRAPQRRPAQRSPAPREDDPRVVRSRAAAVDAAKTLFLDKGYAGTTMEDIAELAGITKRTLYNNYGDKRALFTLIVADTIAYAEAFAQALPAEFREVTTPSQLTAALHDLAGRLALGILRPEVIALRRLLIREAPEFPELASEYFDRAPGRVLVAIAAGFERLVRAGLLHASEPRLAAGHFAYLVAGEPLDHAMLVGTTPHSDEVIGRAREGVETFLARYAATPRARRKR